MRDPAQREKAREARSRPLDPLNLWNLSWKAELHEIRWVPWAEVEALGPDHGLRRALAKARAIVQG